MADQLQLRGGTTNEHSTFTGALREVTVDTDKDTLIVHDAATAGGHPLLREDGSNSAFSLGTAGTPSLKFTGDTNTGIYSPGADQVAVSTGGTERMRIDSSGFVGIGVQNPSSYDSGARNLVVGSSSNTGILIQAGNSSYSNLYFGDGGGAASYRGFVTYNHNEDSLRFGSSGTERMRITSAGRVGIGTSNPAAVLTTDAGGFDPSDNTVFDGVGLFLESSVAGGDGNYGSALAWNRPGSITNFKCAIAPVQEGADVDLQGLAFFTANGPFISSVPTERARLAYTGEWLVYSSGSDTLVAGNAAGSGTSRSLFTGVHTRTSPTGGGTVAYRIYNNGTTFSVSDARQKKNVETARDGYLEDLQQLRVVKYNWIDQADTESKELGLLAQEVAQVFPGLVQLADPSDPESTLGIKSSVFSFMLIKALQEAGEKIEALETRLAALETP